MKCCNPTHEEISRAGVKAFCGKCKMCRNDQKIARLNLLHTLLYTRETFRERVHEIMEEINRLIDDQDKLADEGENGARGS